MVGQEFDTYDDVMLKYMRKLERGQTKPWKDANGETIKPPPNKSIWTPNNFDMRYLENTKPLLDRTNTPRGALRSITLDRNFTKERWLYNKQHMDNFDPNHSKKDLKRAKDLKRISRRETMRASQRMSKSQTR